MANSIVRPTACYRFADKYIPYCAERPEGPHEVWDEWCHGVVLIRKEKMLFSPLRMSKRMERIWDNCMQEALCCGNTDYLDEHAASHNDYLETLEPWQGPAECPEWSSLSDHDQAEVCRAEEQLSQENSERFEREQRRKETDILLIPDKLKDIARLIESLPCDQGATEKIVATADLLGDWIENDYFLF